MTTSQDKAPGQDEVEPAAEQTIPDLEVTGEDAEDVKGGFRAIRSTTRGFPSVDQPEEQ